jgi:K+-sensing histidine kinase KdpD
VLLVGRAARRVGQRVRRLVACLDGSELAERALPVATNLAQRLTGELVLVRVVPDGRFAPGERPELAYLHVLAARLRGPAPWFDVMQDCQPANAIARYAGDRGDTIVGRHPRPQWPPRPHHGQRRTRVTHQASCPVLVVPRRAGHNIA